MNKLIVEDLKTEAINTAGLETDSRWKRWAKFVDRVDSTQVGGYAFVGPFIDDGTLECSVPQARVILCASVTGSRKYQITTYGVVILRPDGSLESAAIGTDDSRKGWALRIRDDVAALVASLKE